MARRQQVRVGEAVPEPSSASDGAASAPAAGADHGATVSGAATQESPSRLQT